jgi:hypothetical protein
MVKLNDPLMAKKYGHRDPPGLGFFRKGNYVKYDGKIKDELPHAVHTCDIGIEVLF